MLLLCFISFAVFGIYNVIEVKSIYHQLTDEQIKKTTKETLDQNLAYLEMEATLIQQDFEKVEKNLLLLQKQSEYVFSQPPGQLNSLPKISLVNHPLGFYWEPVDRHNDRANIFISAHAKAKTGLIYKDLQKTKQLEPLLKQTIDNESTLKAVFFILSESAWIIYPAMDAPYEVAINKLPPDIIVQEHEFYYMADKSHNPEKTVKWTKNYNDVTQWGRVITALVPVYLPDGTFRGVIGADVPINKITTRIESLSLDTQNAYAFIVDQDGTLVAGNEDRFNSQFQSTFPLKLPHHEKTSNGTQRIWTDDAGEQYYILSAEIPNTKWTLHFSIPKNDMIQPIILQTDQQLSNKLNQFIHRLVLFLLCTSGLLIILSYAFSRRIIRPVKQLTKAIQQNASGMHGSQIQVHSYDEIGQLTLTFNEMSSTIHQLVKQLKLRADMLEEKVSERTKELAHSNEQLLHTLERLKHSEQARTELILHVSHDLKTPLTKIKGFLQVIKEYDLSEIKQKEYVELVLLQTNHIIALINDLFELSSLHVDDLHFEKEWYPIDFLVDHAIEMECKVHSDHSINITKTYEEELPLLFIDPKKMNRAFTNILSNAVKYAKPNGDVSIQCSIFMKNDHCYLIFQDNGIGISNENVSQIFDPFYRDERIKHEIIGSGMGMSIVQKIITGHGGTIDVKSKINEGTIVTISLPIKNPSPTKIY